MGRMAQATSSVPFPTSTQPPQAENRPVARSWRLREGDPVVPGRRVLMLLGGGERYEAYLAWDERLVSPVVAKMLRPDAVEEKRAAHAARREARALETLQHPVLVRMFENALEAERPHLVLEFLDGPRLSTLIRKWGPLSAEQLIPLARQLASALAYIDHAGWVHLDVKPRNIIMTGSPRLIDLSLARTIADARSVSSPVGTDAYMAPEQCLPDRFGEIGPAADVWGLATTVYEALTGRQAFPAQPNDRFPQLHVAPPEMPAKAPRSLAEALTAGLRPAPGDRPTALEFYDLLDPLADWSHRRIRRLR